MAAARVARRSPAAVRARQDLSIAGRARLGGAEPALRVVRRPRVLAISGVAPRCAGRSPLVTAMPRSTQSLRIVVTGLIAQHPWLGGLTWHYLQYVLGLLNLGHDVYYVEDSGEGPYTVDGGALGHDWQGRDAPQN